MFTFAQIARLNLSSLRVALPAVVLLSLSTAGSSASAQCPGEWLPGISFFGGTIRAFVTMPNGDLIAGAAAGVFRWTGSSWSLLSGAYNP